MLFGPDQTHMSGRDQLSSSAEELPGKVEITNTNTNKYLQRDQAYKLFMSFK